MEEASDHMSYTEYMAAAHKLCKKIALFGFKDDCFKDMMRRTTRVHHPFSFPVTLALSRWDLQLTEEN